MKRISLFLLLVVLFCQLSYSITLKVPQDYPTVQEAVNDTQSGDTVLVDRGTWGNVLI
jgi:preprotein translocase subunit YajC